MNTNLKMCAFLLAAAALSVTSACNKDDDDDNKSASEILTSVSCWGVTKSEGYDAATNTWIVEPVDACTQDDCNKFNADKTLAFDEGATKCDPSDPQSYTGTWSLSADNKQLTTNTLGFTLVSDITSIGSDKLVLESEFFGFKTRTTLQPK